MTNSYHIFTFPFQWKLPQLNNQDFSEQISLESIKYSKGSNWERICEPENEKDREILFNEKNYFYEFVHDALYDNGKEGDLIRHFERREPKHSDVSYQIECDKKTYRLKADAINLNIYSTGVGVLSFYLRNDSYTEQEDILNINQYGRRVYPPFFADKNLHGETAKSISIEGLHGSGLGYREDFSRCQTSQSNKPARFIQDMIKEVATDIEIKSVIDDRMYVMSWYKNNELAKSFKEDYQTFKNRYGDFWYKYMFVDAKELTCKNKRMKEDLLDKSTYLRWQEEGSLYGISRYSLVYLAGVDCPDFLTSYFETEYARMTELILVQKASVLRFSSEVTNISSLKNREADLSRKVSSLYQEYIRFVNQIHFREVSAQDQGIEIYDMLYKTACLEKHVEKLDNEIEELYNFISLREDRQSNEVMAKLTKLATFFVPATFIAGIFGMNNSFFGPIEKNNGSFKIFFNCIWVQLIILFAITALIYWIIIKYFIKNKGGKK